MNSGLKTQAFSLDVTRSEYGLILAGGAHPAFLRYAPRRASASAERSLRSRCRSRPWMAKRRRSWARRRGHGSEANAEAGVRRMRSASCHESAERELAAPLRWTTQ